MAKDSEKKKKIKIPKSVLELKMSPKKFAKKHNIKLKGKGLTKKQKKQNKKRLDKEYAKYSIDGLNKAVKILAENPDAKKIDKVERSVDNIISNPEVMRRIAKLYAKDPKNFPNMIYLPNMIMNTIVYYNSDNISDEEKEIGKHIDAESLIEFCEKILKKEIKRYKKFGLEQEVAYQFATVVPSTKILRKGNRAAYKNIIRRMYDIAEHIEVDIDAIIKSIIGLDKKKYIKKSEFLNKFFSEFILQKSTNKNAKFTDNQKELHEGLIERTLAYLNSLKSRELKEILKVYIKRRRTAENYKNDVKRVIKFTDHANSNSPYDTIKKVVQELIEDKADNEIYLS